jgi:hypothetical protein
VTSAAFTSDAAPSGERSPPMCSPCRPREQHDVAVADAPARTARSRPSRVSTPPCVPCRRAPPSERGRRERAQRRVHRPLRVRAEERHVLQPEPRAHQRALGCTDEVPHARLELLLHRLRSATSRNA